jgi:hypothetical protein
LQKPKRRVSSKRGCVVIWMTTFVGMRENNVWLFLLQKGCDPPREFLELQRRLSPSYAKIDDLFVGDIGECQCSSAFLSQLARGCLSL